MSFSVSDFFVVGGFDEGWLDTQNLDASTAFHLSAHLDGCNMIEVVLEKLPTVPLEPLRIGNGGLGLQEYSGGGIGGFMSLGLVERDVQLWEGDACGTCMIGGVAGFCDVVGCGRQRCGTARASVEIMVTSCIMVAVQRAAVALAPETYDLWASIPVRIVSGGYSFVKDVSLDFAADGELLTSGAEKLLADFFSAPESHVVEQVLLERDVEEATAQATVDFEEGWGNVCTLVPRVSLDGADDDAVSIVSGRGGDVGFEEDRTEGVGFGERLDDYLLLRSGSAVEKNRSVAGALLTMLRCSSSSAGFGDPGRGVVIVFGDAPGVISRELASRGVRVLGVDRDERHAAPPGWHANYRTVRASVTGGTTVDELYEWLGSVGWGGLPVLAAIGDIDQGARRTGVEDSVLNKQLVEMVISECEGAFGIARFRGLPPTPIECAVLNTRHHEPQGAEVYCVLGANGRVVRGLSAFEVSSWHLNGELWLRVTTCSEVWTRHLRERGLGCDAEDGERREMNLRGEAEWLAFLGQRNGVEERLLAGTPFMRAGLEAKGILPLVGRLRQVMGKIRPERVAELSKKFEPGDRVYNRHISRATLSVSPGLVRTMQVRYDHLLKYCSMADDQSQCPPLGEFTKHPGFGALLWWSYSRVRDEMGVVLPYTQFARVLPLAAMPVLASRAWVRMVAWLLRAYDRVMGKPLHTWELQALLWSLSHVGTQEEREVYFWGRLQGAVDTILASRRRGQRTVGAASADLNRILSAMEALGSRKLGVDNLERVAFLAAYARCGRGEFRHDSDYRRGSSGMVRRGLNSRPPGVAQRRPSHELPAHVAHHRVASGGSSISSNGGGVPGVPGFSPRKVG